MSLKHTALGGAILALCAGFAVPPAAAQSVHCADLYNRVMATYRVAPLSPEYNQMAGAYAASCLGGASITPAYPLAGAAPAVPAYPQNYAQYYAPYPAPSYGYPPYYGYADYPYYYGDYGYGIGFGFGGGFRGGGFRGGGFHGGGFHGGGGHGGGGGRR
jgi:uncharacterized membrane protein YgcG